MLSAVVQKFWPPRIWSVVLVADDGPALLCAMAVYVVVIDGAVTLIVQAVDAMPLFQAQDVTGVPSVQVSARLTLVPGATAVAVVLGVWTMLHPAGGSGWAPT